MKNIIENNKLIAEFMGLELPLKITEYSSLICSNNGNYHKDWNWLMKVVEKIESLSHEQKVINWSRQNKNIFDFKLTESKIEAVYNACVEFIKWYNNQK